jgi:quercetin dioxygenase-like cupin family protein
VLKSSDVLARIFTLAPGDTIPWHYHQHCTDHFFVLEGVLSISTREPALTRKLSVGQSHKIVAGTAHLVVNGGNHDCRFLLLQGVGTYDWNPAE